MNRLSLAVLLLSAPVLAKDATGIDEMLTLQKGVTGGGYTEFQVAPPNDKPDWSKFEHWKKDSLFLHYEGATLLWQPFHDVDPGFDVFAPRLFDPQMLARLATSLDAFKKDWLALKTLADAKERWAKFSPPIRDLKTEADWKHAQQVLAQTIDELARWARGLSAKKQWGWVLGC